MTAVLSTRTIRFVSLVLLAVASSFNSGQAQEEEDACEEFGGCRLCEGPLLGGWCEFIICDGNDVHFLCVWGDGN